MRIAIPIEEDKGKEAIVCTHFGQTPSWAVYDTEKEELSIKRRESVHGGGGCAAVDEIMELKPDMIFVLGMGMGAVNKFDSLGVKVRSGDFHTVGEVLDNLENLSHLENACAGHDH